jgi:hypothetical protein
LRTLNILECFMHGQGFCCDLDVHV